MSKLTQLKKPVIIGGTLLLGVSGITAMALNSQQSGANEVPEIFTQVAEHEQRIDGLEGRQATTEAKVEQNSSDIQAVQQTTGSSSSTSSPTTTTATQGTTSSPAASQPVSEPQPAPEPAKDPRTIVAVAESVSGGLRTCDYTLYDRAEDTYQGAIIQPENRACHAVGEVLPRY